MRRAKQFQLYGLGHLHRARELTSYKPEHFEDILTMTWLLAQFFAITDENKDLKGAVDQAKLIAKKSRELANKVAAKQEYQDWELTSIEQDVAKFENLLEYDLNRQHVYAIDKIGIFNTDDLIEHAEEHLPSSIRDQVNEKTKADFKAAGRCLAFQLFTASGYHALRALEAKARKYHKLVLNLPEEAEKPLGPIANDLRKLLEMEEHTKSSDSPLGLIIINLTRMNKIYRQPLTHPDMVISNEDDARDIFNLVTSSITLMEKNLSERGLPKPGSIFDNATALLANDQGNLNALGYQKAPDAENS